MAEHEEGRALALRPGEVAVRRAVEERVRGQAAVGRVLERFLRREVAGIDVDLQALPDYGRVPGLEVDRGHTGRVRGGGGDDPDLFPGGCCVDVAECRKARLDRFDAAAPGRDQAEVGEPL